MALTNKLCLRRTNFDLNEQILTSTNKFTEKMDVPTNPLRKRKRGKVFTAADSTPIQARIPNAMFLEIERAAQQELISVADFVRAALLEKLKQRREKP
jgi:hypothetical protein